MIPLVKYIPIEEDLGGQSSECLLILTRGIYRIFLFLKKLFDVMKPWFIINFYLYAHAIGRLIQMVNSYSWRFVVPLDLDHG